MFLLLALLSIGINAYQVELFKNPTFASQEAWDYTIDGEPGLFCQDTTCSFPYGWSTEPSAYGILMVNMTNKVANCTQEVIIPRDISCTNFTLTISIRTNERRKPYIYGIWNGATIYEFDRVQMSSDYTNISIGGYKLSGKSIIVNSAGDKVLRAGIKIKQKRTIFLINAIYLTAECSSTATAAVTTLVSPTTAVAPTTTAIITASSAGTNGGDASDTTQIWVDTEDQSDQNIISIISLILIIVACLVGILIVVLICLRVRNKIREPRYTQIMFANPA